MERIHVRIDASGELSIEIDGMRGGACLEVLEHLDLEAHLTKRELVAATDARLRERDRDRDREP